MGPGIRCAVLLAAWPGPFAIGSPSQTQPAAKPLNDEGVRALLAGDYGKALERFQRAAKLAPNDSSISFNEGLACFIRGQYREAIGPLRRSMADPGSAEKARYLLGASHYQIGDLAAAARDCTDRRCVRSRSRSS